MHRWFSRELGRNLEERLGDEYRHWIEVAGVRLQRNRPAATKRVIHRRRLAIARLQNLRPRRLEHALVVRVVPLYQLADDGEEPLAPLLSDHFLQRRLRSGVRHGSHSGVARLLERRLPLLPRHLPRLEDRFHRPPFVPIGEQFLRVLGRVIHQRRKQHRPARRQRPPRPPQVQRERCPCRMDFSRATSRLMSSSGRATSMSFFL